MVVSLLLVHNFSIGVSASANYDRQEADACITINQRLTVRGGSSIDINNYNFETSTGRKNLVNNISKQYYQRIDQLPQGTKQSVLIDIRGQNISNADLESLYNSIMEKTNNGVTVYFKTDE